MANIEPEEVGTKVLDHGYVYLDDYMGSDLSVVNSARVSYATRHNFFKEGDDKLINFLMREKHGTPFEHNAFRFVAKVPIFVLREWHRHRIGSFNELSGRYTKLPGDYYLPDVENVRIRVGKAGAYVYDVMNRDSAERFIGDLDFVCEQSYRLYEGYLETGLAPELARLFLHVNHYSIHYWTVNARSLMNFLSLRNSATAQWEIREYAKKIEEIFAEIMPSTYEAFLVNGRVAP